MEYLGHVILEEGISPNPDKVKAVCEFPVPTSVKGVRQFLGTASYYRRFMPSPACIDKGECALLLVDGLSKCIPEAEGFADDSPCVGVPRF